MAEQENPLRFIVTKNGEYLVSVPYSDTLFVRWSYSKFDAARFWRRSTAVKVANRVGGRVLEFNTLTGVIS
jgi:hypothetical protein